MSQEKYGWTIDGEEHAHGPFNSVEEALEDAVEYLSDFHSELAPTEYEISVGTCQFADPAAYVPSNMDDLLERMNEIAYDNGFCDEDDTFYVSKDQKEEAKKALDEALSAWATKYVMAEEVWLLCSTKPHKVTTVQEDANG